MRRQGSSWIMKLRDDLQREKRLVVEILPKRRVAPLRCHKEQHGDRQRLSLEGKHAVRARGQWVLRRPYAVGRRVGTLRLCRGRATRPENERARFATRLSQALRQCAPRGGLAFPPAGGVYEKTNHRTTPTRAEPIPGTAKCRRKTLATGPDGAFSRLDDDMVQRGEQGAKQPACGPPPQRRIRRRQDVAGQPEGSKHSSPCRVSPVRFVWNDRLSCL